MRDCRHGTPSLAQGANLEGMICFFICLFIVNRSHFS